MENVAILARVPSALRQAILARVPPALRQCAALCAELNHRALRDTLILNSQFSILNSQFSIFKKFCIMVVPSGVRMDSG